MRRPDTRTREARVDMRGAEGGGPCRTVAGTGACSCECRGPGARCRATGRLAVGGLALAALLAACGGSAGAKSASPSSVADTGSIADTALVGGRDTALVRVARSVLPSVERESGLSATRPLAVARTTRRRLQSYMMKEFQEDLPADRARAVKETYVRLGLLPDSLDLRTFLRKLYLEQVVGYYDPTRDTLYVRQGVADADFKTVLVHEMVHALQDEHMSLDSLLRAREDDNDASTAAHAALEGQATYVMVEWLLRQRTGSNVDLTAMPQVVDMISGANLLSAGASSMPELAAAPAFIRASLVFPYQAGLAFIEALWSAHPGRPAPLGANMPVSTEQILHPAHFLSSERDVPSDVSFTADSASLKGGWTQAHEDDLGEFETRFFLSTFLGDTARARSAATGWDGDRYRLLRRCPAGPDPEGGAGPGGAATNDACPEAFVWASVWDGQAAAATFAAAVREAFAARYGSRPAGRSGSGGQPSAKGASPAPDEHAPGGGSVADTLAAAGRIVTVTRRSVDGRPTVLVVDRPLGVDPATIESAARFSVKGGR